jgi:hypothetical protein
MKKKNIPDQVEKAKRSAAGQAHSTKGRARTFKDKTIYDRKTNRSETAMTDQEFTVRQDEILANIPKEFHSALSSYAYREGHGCGMSDVLIILQDLVNSLETPIEQYRQRIVNDIL